MIKFNSIYLYISLFLLISCTAQEEQKQNEDLVKTVNVHVQQIHPREFTSYVQLIGDVESANDVRLSAEVGGRVLSYYKEQGERVEKGEVIAKIDDEHLQSEKQRLEALTRQSREQYQRQKKLWKQDSIGSEMTYLNAKYQYQQNKATLEQVKVNIGNSRIKAPFQGVMDKKLVEEGETVNPGTPLVRLIASDQMKVSVGVPARYSDVISVGDTALIWFDTLNKDTLRAPIRYVSNSIERQTRTFEAEILLPSGQQRYKVGMLASTKLRLHHFKKAIVVGSEFIYQKKDHYVAYTVDENKNGEKVARERKITLGPSFKNEVMVEDGLKPGDRFITVGSSYLENDMRIEIVEENANTFAKVN